MKLLIISLILSAVIFSGCKKDNSAPKTPATKTYLLSTVTYTTSPAAFTFVDTYTYDSKNRVIEFSSTGTGRDFKYTYDDNNNLVTALIYQTGSNPKLNFTDKFTYAPGKVTDDEVDDTNFPWAHTVFTLNDKNEVTYTSDVITYTYDSNGNLTGYVEDGTLKDSGTYTYDNKKHPLSMIGAKNVHLMFLTGFGFSNVNNIVHMGNSPDDYTYTYNDAGFPVTRTNLASMNDNRTHIATYSYIVK
ncbi:MAG TPA: hypothetical protein VK668_22025 [Mucilaginibacter sp.]|nr:hypothetical protein [Mucilaginibacter sp.]